MERRKVKNGEKSPWDNVLPDQFQTVAAVLASDWCQKNTSFQVSVLYFSSCHIFPPVQTFPRPHYLPPGLRGCDVGQCIYQADLATERERHLTTVKRVERTNLDFRCPICHTAIGQASYLVCARPALSTDVPVLLLNQPVTPALSVKLMRAFSSTSLWQRM